VPSGDFHEVCANDNVGLAQQKVPATALVTTTSIFTGMMDYYIVAIRDQLV
jgi:hypothetical protein